MTVQQEQELFRMLRSLKKEVGELREMLIPCNPVDDEFFNTKKAAEILGIGSTKMKELLKSGELPFATKLGRQWRFSKNGIINYLSRTK